MSLEQEICKYKQLIEEQQKILSEQQLFIQKLQKDIDRILPFVEFTRTLEKENPKLWQHYASKTIKNKK